MNDDEAVDATRAGWDLLAMYARNIAILPLEDWLQAMDRAETVAPMIDPTLYIRAHRSMAEVRKMIEAAMPLKRFVLKMQPAAPTGCPPHDHR